MPRRTASGRRVYGPAEIRILTFTGEEVRALLALGGPERAPCADVHKIASAHLANVRNKLCDLIKSIPGGNGRAMLRRRYPDCPVLDILDAGPAK